MNWEEACQILGIPFSATADEIRAQYIYKAQLLHPDKTMGLPESVRHKAEEELKQVNAAYAVLKDLKNSPQNNPPKLSVSPLNIRFKDIEPDQKKTTIIEIESIGGAYTKFWMDDSPAKWLKVIEVKSTTNDPLPLEVTIEATGNSILGKQTECSLPIRIENEKTKTKDELTVRIQIQMKVVTKPNIFSIFGIKIQNPFTKSKPSPTPNPFTYTPKPQSTRQHSEIFLISDTHFDHKNIIDYCNRPFRRANKSRDLESMNRTLVSNWNRAVGRNDVVFFLGDLVCGRGARTPGYWLSRLNGRKIMIRGSHDQHVHGTRNNYVLNYNGMRFLLVHDPNYVKNWSGWIIHGHKHTDDRGNCPTRYPFINGHNKTINVNVELIGYKPVNLDYICSLGLDKIKRMDFINSVPERW
jgi:calcineurin-like phosphoesterase family protein